MGSIIPNREVSLGLNTKRLSGKPEFEVRKHSFSTFQFPACAKCNNEFSTLEEDAKQIVEEILAKDYITNIEITRILDWFDKIRVGLWLGNILLNRDSPLVYPKFFIKNRISDKDRCLILYEMKDNWQGLQFGGTNLPAFTYTPSCFSLCINNLYFINISIDYLFSRNIGFPYPVKKLFRTEDRRTLMLMSPGLNKLKTPLLKYGIIQPSIQIYQPMIATKLVENHDTFDDFYNCEYVKESCLDYENGIGAVFYMEGNKLERLDDDYEICLSDNDLKFDRNSIMPQIMREIVDLQYFLLKDYPSVDLLSPEERRSTRVTFNAILQAQKAIRTLTSKERW